MNKSLFISKEDLDLLRKKEIGRGKDGAVYKLNLKSLIKIYHKKSHELDVLESDDIKIYVPSEKKIAFNNTRSGNFITYMANDGSDVIKLASEEALYRAIERQKYVTRTHLPEQVLYVNNRFSGCVLHRLYGIPIHKLTGLLSKEKKKKILLEVLFSLNELFDNFIYHCDLSNNPYAKVRYVNEFGKVDYMNGHSHVLINPFTLKTEIIDLDGKSTIYTEKRNEELIEISMANFATLIIEFLLGLESQVMELSYETEETLRFEMEKLNLKAEYIEMLIEGRMTPTQAEDIIKSL